MTASPIIVALDYPCVDAALDMARQLDPGRVRVKVGKELFTSAGPGVVEQLHTLGFQVFLDLKFHDIPNTVAGAVRAAASLGVWMINVHASGGARMIAAAAEAAANAATPPILTAVTVLTSMSAAELADTGVAGELDQQVLRLASLAAANGADGVVCSAREASMLRAARGTDFCLVTPGIRPPGAEQGDQTRIVTPADALALGVDYLVIGRPITGSANPSTTVDEIIQSLSATA